MIFWAILVLINISLTVYAYYQNNCERRELYKDIEKLKEDLDAVAGKKNTALERRVLELDCKIETFLSSSIITFNERLAKLEAKGNKEGPKRKNIKLHI